MKIVKLALVLGALAVLLGMTTLSVAAQQPDTSDPVTAPYIDNQPHTIPANTTQYYRFDYNGSGSQIVLVLTDRTEGDLAFNVYTPEQIHETSWWQYPPIGRGTSPACEDCIPNSDLLWAGSFPAAGTYTVEVKNFDDTQESFTLRISGDGVTVMPNPESGAMTENGTTESGNTEMQMSDTSQ